MLSLTRAVLKRYAATGFQSSAFQEALEQALGKWVVVSDVVEAADIEKIEVFRRYHLSA